MNNNIIHLNLLTKMIVESINQKVKKISDYTNKKCNSIQQTNINNMCKEFNNINEQIINNKFHLPTESLEKDLYNIINKFNDNCFLKNLIMNYISLNKTRYPYIIKELNVLKGGSSTYERLPDLYEFFNEYNVETAKGIGDIIYPDGVNIVICQNKKFKYY